MDNITIIENKCYGCRSCEQVCPKSCITIKPTKEGFLYPYVEEKKCVSCGLCLKACPAERIKEHRNKPQSVWAFRNKSTEEIMKSASGGAADIATSIILQHNGVVYGAVYDENFIVKHAEVTNKAEKSKLQSSKYVQSDINDCYSKTRKMLRSGKIVLFTGTPCQIAGLYAFLGGDAPNLYTLDLICHGVPSPRLFEKYLEYQNRKMKGKVLYFNFRSKDKRGWGTQYLLKTKTKTKTKTLALDRYGKHFMEGDCYRECCYQCVYANIDRIGDITVGDFWGIDQTHPDFYSAKGVSSVFVNTEKGNKLFDQMKRLADVIPVTVKDGMVKQRNLIKPTIRPSSRDSFYKNIDEDNYIDEIKVGLEIKERIKSVLPLKVLKFIKQKCTRRKMASGNSSSAYSRKV